MEYIFGSITAALNIPGSVACAMENASGVEKRVFTVRWSKDDMPVKPALTLKWRWDIVDIQYQWHALCGMDRSLRPDWSCTVRSKISSGSPLHCFYNDAGMNRLTVALDDCTTLIERRFGVREEDACLDCIVDIPLDATGLIEEYAVTLYFDIRDVRYEQAISAVAKWWEQKYPPMPTPDAAWQPLYSCWYSFHQQTIAHEIEEECVRAAEAGLKTVIVDDGWQTDNNARGYAYCGDWQVAPGKIPDMRAHVAKVHETGMKYMLWYSVPFVGRYSQAAKHFEGKFLSYNENSGAYTLDPRYPEARQYLIDIYVNALRDWDMDGLKLDFIDSFRMTDTTPLYREGMDYAVLEDAVRRLMVDVMQALRAVKPDVLIEFRQSYIGPVMREFGNMFRVGDCPNTTSTNRIGMVDLRLTSGDTAVHSDMLMWHANDKVENAVMQIQNIMFCTMQLSVRLDRLNAEHSAAVRFWTDFMAREIDLLQRAPIIAEQPQNLYPVVRTEKDGRSVIACYSAGHVVNMDGALREVFVINAAHADRLTLDVSGGGEFEAAVYDCTGRLLRTERHCLAGLSCICVPAAGFIKLRRL